MNQSVPQAHYAEMGQDESTAIEGGKKVVTSKFPKVSKMKKSLQYYPKRHNVKIGHSLITPDY